MKTLNNFNNKVTLNVNRNYNSWLKYSSYALQLLVMIGLSVWGGIRSDAWLNVSPLFTITLPLLVLAGTFYKLIKDTTKKKNANGEKQ